MSNSPRKSLEATFLSTGPLNRPRNILIYGTDRVAMAAYHDLLENLEGDEIIGLISDNVDPQNIETPEWFPYNGSITAFNEAEMLSYLQRHSPEEDASVFFSIGARQCNNIRSQRFEEVSWKFVHNTFSILTFIHPRAYISKSAHIGLGVWVRPFAHIDAMTELGDGVIVGSNVTICVNAKIGNFAYISPGVVIGSNSVIGARSMISSCAVIENKTILPEETLVCSGAVVTQKFNDKLEPGAVFASGIDNFVGNIHSWDLVKEGF